MKCSVSSSLRFASVGIALITGSVMFGFAQGTIYPPPPDDGYVRTVVEIRAIDAVATEPAEANSNLDPAGHVDVAVFRVHRTGPTDLDLPVFYQVRGTALNGVDYAGLPGEILIPAGSFYADLIVKPLADREAEPSESVLVRLVPPLCVAIYPPPPGCYILGESYTAAAAILDHDGVPENLPPQVAILSPEEGAVFKTGEAIPVQVETVDKDGYAPTVSLFADGVLIGQQTISFFVAPPPGEPIQFDFVWDHALPGPHVLTAVGEDERGARGFSAPVRILVEGEVQVPEVNVVATDPEAAEPDPVPEGMLRPLILDTGVFTVSRRGGDLNLPLTVYYMLGGTAESGVDYDRLPWSVTIPSGLSEAQVVVVPIDDLQPEPKESVILTLMPPPYLDPVVAENGLVVNIWPAPYRIGPHYRDVVTIADNDLGTDVPPKVAIVRPANGSVFLAPATIDLVAQAFDLDGHVRQVEFFEGENSLGVVTRDAANSLVFTPFHLVWNVVEPGGYRLSAVATDDEGLTGRSEPIFVKVVEELPPPADPPIVRIKAIDPIGAERTGFGGTSTMTFRIKREGRAEESLSVYLKIGGQAENGTDYEAVRPVVTIPAGYEWVDLVIQPIADDLREGAESVVVGLIMPPLRDPAVDSNVAISPTYLIGTPSRAAGLLLDYDQVRPPCFRLADGLYHLCRPGDNGTCYRIEVSNDLRHWEILEENQVTDGAVHYVDPDGALLRYRFYRVIPIPCEPLDGR